MGKIICDICGTRYMDTADQCPICGHIRDGAAGKVTEDAFEMDFAQHEPRQKVSGGRFSKSNVKKRTAGTVSYEEVPVAPVKKSKPAKKVEKEQPEKSPKQKKQPKKEQDEFFTEDNQNKKVNTILNVLLVIVILALLGVTAYIFMQYVLPEIKKPEPTTAPTIMVTEPVPTEPVVTEEPTYPCEELFLGETEVLLAEYEQKWLINVEVSPANTTDALTFTSSDETIATVDSEGCITALAEGQAVITITCGNVTAEYNVVCFFPGVDIQPGWEPTEPPPTDPPEEWIVVTKTVVNIRTGPDKEYDKVRQCKNGEKVYVYETKYMDDIPWGRVEDGWICLSYAKKAE